MTLVAAHVRRPARQIPPPPGLRPIERAQALIRAGRVMDRELPDELPFAELLEGAAAIARSASETEIVRSAAVSHIRLAAYRELRSRWTGGDADAVIRAIAREIRRSGIATAEVRRIAAKLEVEAGDIARRNDEGASDGS